MPALGPYQLVRALAEGGQASVWEGRGPGGARVALKRLHAERLLQPGARERFARESAVLRGLDHPGLVRLLDAGESDGVPFLVYELLADARPLDEACRGLYLRERVRLVLDAARAVAALHARGIAHRDLSPANVLVEPDLRVRVADLGYARAPDQAALTRTGAVLGTPGWIAPEVVLSGSKDAGGPAGDVWSLGLLLYLAVTGAHPFAGIAFPELLERLRRGGPPSPRSVDPDVWPELDQVCRRALAPRAEQRYPDAGALATALEAVLAAEVASSRWTASLAPGTVLEGRWQVLGKLGAGGMGTVLRARDLELERDVAIKLPLAGITEAQRRRFLREVELTASAHHRNLVRVHGGGVLEGGRPFLVLELVEGGTPMQEALQDLPLARRLELVLQLAAAVDHLHQRGIVHRDLKPENVLVDGDGIARLIDLGLARAEGQEALTRSGSALGSPLYMAPEQIHTRRDSPIGPAADVWSLGVILHRALTGKHPFPHEGRTLVELMAMVLERPPTPIRELARDVAPALEAVCLRALSKDPSGRQPDAGAFARELEEAIAAARPVRMGLLVVGTALLAALAGASVAYAVRSRPAPAPIAAAPARSDVAASASAPPSAAPARPPLGALLGRVLPGQAILASDMPPAERQERLRAMLADDERAAAAEPLVARHQLSRGKVLGELGELEASLAALTRAIDLDPASIDAWCERAFLRMRMGDLEGAMADATRATEIGPQEARAWYVRAGVQIGPGTAVLAGIRDLDRAISLDPRLTEAWSARAMAKMMIRDLRGSLEDANRVIELDPDHANARRNRATVKAQLGDLRGAIVDLDRAIELDPEEAENLTNRGQLRFDAGDREGGRLDLERAIELEPNNPSPWYALARVRDLSGDPEGSLEALDRAIEAEPGHLVARKQRMHMREARGELEGALADGVELLRRAPPDAPWRFQLESQVDQLRARLRPDGRRR